MFGTRSTTRAHTRTTTRSTPRSGGLFHRTNPNRRAGGLKAALHNPNTTSTGRAKAKRELRHMGQGKQAHVPLSTRIRRIFHIGARKAGVTGHHTTTTTTTTTRRRRHI